MISSPLPELERPLTASWGTSWRYRQSLPMGLEFRRIWRQVRRFGRQQRRYLRTVFGR
jgi:hypothetical protein